MIPDKIYTDNRGVYAKLPIFSQIDANIEYIRKDALLERIKERLKLYDLDDPDEETACYELQSIISWLDGKEVAE